MNAAGRQWHFYGRPTAFVGRRKPLHVLREAVRNAIDTGRRRAVLLLGGPGIGKSRLISEFIESLDDHVDSATVLHVACRRDGGPPYSLFQRLLRERFYIGADESADQAREKLLAGLQQVMRDEHAGEAAAHFIGHLVGLRYPRSTHILQVGGDPARIEARAVAALAEVLRHDARRVPMVMAIDDLHLAPDESLALLLQVSAAVADAPLLFLGAARDHFRDRQKSFARSFSGVGEVVDLPELSDRECRKVVESLLTRASDVPERFVQAAVGAALGNPLQIEQMIQLQISHGAIEPGVEKWTVHPERLDERVPGTLRDTVRTKLSQLGALERRVLEKAAAIGDVFWSGCVDMLRRADEGHTWDDTDRFWTTNRRTEELLRVFETMRRRHIILRNPTSTFPQSRSFSFKHSVEREVLYEGIEGPRRARYHRLAAQWLESQEPERADRAVEQIATHWERGGLPRKAAGYYIRAGDRAFERHVNQEALALYMRALQCLREDDAIDRRRVFHQLGRVNAVSGDYADALGHFSEMVRLAWLLDDQLQGGQAYEEMGRCYRALGEYDLALEHFKNAMVLFRRVEHLAGLAQCADDIGRVHRMRGDLGLAEERIREALRLNEYIGDDQARAQSLHHLGNVHTERGEFREAVKRMGEALDLARAVGDERTVGQVLMSNGVICAQRGNHDAAIALWTEALEKARLLGDATMEGMLLNNLGEVQLLNGEPGAAKASLDQAIALFERTGNRRGLAEALRNLSAACLHRAQTSKALEHGLRALEEADEVGTRGLAGLAHRNLGEIYSRTLYDDTPDRDERISEARRHFGAAIRDLAEVEFEAELGRALLAAGSFLLELGEEQDAKDRLEQARALFERLDLQAKRSQAEKLLSAL